MKGSRLAPMICNGFYKGQVTTTEMTNSRHWRGVSFVRSTKDILLRCMREKGCKPSDEAQVALEGMPLTFDAWKLRRHTEQFQLPPIIG
jgi:hypothetical protein